MIWKRRKYAFLKANNFEYSYPPFKTELYLNNFKPGWYKQNENIIGKDGNFVIVFKGGTKTCLPKNIGKNWWATVDDAYEYVELRQQQKLPIINDTTSYKTSNQKRRKLKLFHSV